MKSLPRFILWYCFWALIGFPLLFIVSGLIVLGIDELLGNAIGDLAGCLIAPICIFLFFLTLVCIGRVIKKLDEPKAEQRKLEVQGLAERINWEFHSSAEHLRESLAESFPFFRDENYKDKRMANVFRNKAQRVSISVFDFRYTTKPVKTAPFSASQTVFYFQSDALNLPFFELQSWNRNYEDFRTNIGWNAGLKQIVASARDINFQSHPNFSGNYRLNGENELMIRQIFSAQILNLYESLGQGVFTFGAKDKFIYFRHNQLISASNAQNLFNEAFYVFNCFQSALRQNDHFLI